MGEEHSVETRVEAKGDGSVSIGREVINSLINTGVINVFIGKYESIKDAYISPDPVFERVRVEQFVGREWIEKEIDNFLKKEDRGVFILEAEAGLGKTAFLAHLVKKRGYYHHFVERDSRPDRGLKSLAAQLIRAWELEPGLLPERAGDPSFLQDLLFEVAEKRDKEKPDEKIVLVVDGLDEAGIPGGGANVMGLPKTLPKGVYLIVSQRPVDVPLWVSNGGRKVFKLEALKEENQEDMKCYLEKVVTWERIKRVLEESGYGAEEFVKALLEKSQGVWIYLHYVITEIGKGDRSPLSLEALPEGLWQYYREYWSKWRKSPRWYDTYLSLLSTLGAVQEALPLSTLFEFAGIEDKPEVRIVLEEKWRPFLAVESGEDGEKYRLYHTSLKDFLNGSSIDESSLTSADKNFVGELSKATREAHSRIVDYCLERWGGLEDRLHRLSDLELWKDAAHTDRYGLRHISTHLIEADRWKELRKLLSLEERREGKTSNLWFQVKESLGDIAGYVLDLEQAWNKADKLHDRCESIIW